MRMSCWNIDREQFYEQVKMACRDAVKEKGLDRITVEDLVQVNWEFVTAITFFISGGCPARKSTGARWCEERAAEGNQNIFRTTGWGLISLNLRRLCIRIRAIQFDSTWIEFLMWNIWEDALSAIWGRLPCPNGRRGGIMLLCSPVTESVVKTILFCPNQGNCAVQKKQRYVRTVDNHTYSYRAIYLPFELCFVHALSKAGLCLWHFGVWMKLRPQFDVMLSFLIK